ncbi:MAG: SDR family oxidoreductase [Rhizobiaceae bacterium]
MPETKRVFVTGASGFIAKHIVLMLLRAGYQVTGSVRSNQRAMQVVEAIRPHLANDVDLDEALTFVELDLNSDEGWNEAFENIDILLHTASPVPTGVPDNEDDVVRPAVNGTLRALRAAAHNNVKRVVLTSSIAAVAYRADLPQGAVFDESHWSDIDHPTCLPYAKSKTLAERAAWDFVENQAPEMQLTAINPGFVFGPPLDSHFQSSMYVLLRMLAARDPALPKIGFNAVDVRDIARMHVRAINNPETYNQRIIGVSGFVWIQQVAQILKTAHPTRKIVTRTAPNWLIRLLAVFDRQLRSIVPSLGRPTRFSTKQAEQLLGIEFIDIDQSVTEASNYMVEHELV